VRSWMEAGGGRGAHGHDREAAEGEDPPAICREVRVLC
jgi:hypothetical protein